MDMATVYLGIGSNIGNKQLNCREVIRRLQQTGNIRVSKCSQLYVTKPVNGPPQEDYLNGAVEVETDTSPEELLQELKTIEKSMGREDSPVKNAPRIIDIDILLYDNLVLDKDGLIIPHPGMHEREFVLRGLSEIAPEVVHPALGKTIKELYAGL